MTSWVRDAAGSGFDVDHLPLGVAVVGNRARIVTRIGNDVVVPAELFPDRPELTAATLNPFLAAGPGVWELVRQRLTRLLTDPAGRAVVEPYLAPVADVTMLMPVDIGDYVDFYASEHHATALGRMFRPGAEPLLPNWKHLPVGYHGRSGTVIVTGTPVVRPGGQLRPPGAEAPVHGPTTKLDLEAEVGFVVGTASQPGTPVRLGAFASTVFGVCLVNDWSARDIQPWEYQPLGPFVAKSFATSMSGWITPLAALAAARVDPPERTTPLLPYLADDGPWGLDLRLAVAVNGTVVSRPPFASTYWTGAQLLAHLTVGGASVRPGDLYASGTVSGPDPGTAGSLIELTANGTHPLALADGSTRAFLADGDTVTISATAPTATGHLTLGEVTGTVLPARR